MTQRLRIIASVALLTVTALALGGCLVTKKTPEPPYKRKSETLRIYQDGEWIRYNVQAQLPGATDFQYGTLLISWKKPDLPYLTGPDGQNYPVIEKHYQLCLTGTYCEPDETEIIQYIHQDDPDTDPDTAGTERFVAMDTATQGQYYWVSTDGSTQQGGTGLPLPAVTLSSPLQSKFYNSNYFLMNDCGSGSCTSDLAKVENTFTVLDDNTLIRTNVENFADPFHFKYNNLVIPRNNSPLPTPVDLFSLCSTNDSPDNVTSNGDMYVVPEIGMIWMQGSCQEAGAEPAYYTFSIDSPSFSY